MPSKKVVTPVERGRYYHIFNRGNNKELVYFQNEDYFFFLNRLEKYILSECELLAYALLPNHYHLLVRIKDSDNQCFSKQFKKAILSYTNTFNKKYNRSGNLFAPVFKRLRVTNEMYLIRLVSYIHQNPENHEIVNDFREFDFSSYKAYNSKKESRVNRKEILELFDGIENFNDYHMIRCEERKLKDLAME